jgi:hypothetical protein
MKNNIWLSYDLGIRGDYSGLYQWLDDIGAEECGNNVAFFKMEIEESEDFLEKLLAEIKRNVEMKSGERFYVIYKRPDGKYAGKYIIGNRRANPWKGYKEQPAEEDV